VQGGVFLKSPRVNYGAEGKLMSMCSKHSQKRPDCRLCNTDPRDVFPNWDEKLARAKAAGIEHCLGCGFDYYRTTSSCPKCGRRRM
jgi:hypothetical protein